MIKGFKQPLTACMVINNNVSINKTMTFTTKRRAQHPHYKTIWRCVSLGGLWLSLLLLPLAVNPQYHETLQAHATAAGPLVKTQPYASPKAQQKTTALLTRLTIEASTSQADFNQKIRALKDPQTITLVAQYLKQSAETFKNKEDYEKAIASYNYYKWLCARKQLAPTADRAHVSYHQGVCFGHVGAAEKQQACFEESASLCKKLEQSKASQKILTNLTKEAEKWSDKGYAQLSAKNPKEALPSFIKSNALFQSLDIEKFQKQIADTWFGIGDCKDKLGDYKQANKAYKNSRAQYQKINHRGAYTYTIADLYFRQAQCLFLLGQYTKALACVDESWQRYKADKTTYQQHIARILDYKIDCQVRLGDHVQVMATCAEVLAAYKAFGDDKTFRPKRAAVWFTKGEALLREKEHAQALDCFHTSRKLYETPYQRRHNPFQHKIAMTWYRAAECALYLNQYEEALGYTHQFIAAYAPLVNASPEKYSQALLSTAWYYQGLAHAHLAQWQKALYSYKEAVTIFSSFYPKAETDFWHCVDKLTTALAQIKNPDSEVEKAKATVDHDVQQHVSTNRWKRFLAGTACSYKSDTAPISFPYAVSALLNKPLLCATSC